MSTSLQPSTPSLVTSPQRIGLYTLYEEIGRGGMASVHIGRLRSPTGLTRTVAIKRMHSELARSPEFVAMFFEEARLVAHINHPNVVAALDCVALENTALLVMDYVHGLSLDKLMRQHRGLLPQPIASAIVIGAALGLHAAHQAVDDDGKRLAIVHRDVSPHNILVGVDGLARVLDFGIAKAAERANYTRTGQIRGKLEYMAPEQLMQNEVGVEADIYALGVILWELLTGRRFFADESHGQIMMRIANGSIDPPRSVNPNISPEMEAVIMKALSSSPRDRQRTALEFAAAVETSMPPAPQRQVGEWITSTGCDELTRQMEIRTKIDTPPKGIAGAGTGEQEEITTSRLRMAELVGVGAPAQPASAESPAPPRRRRPYVAAVATALGAATLCAGFALWHREPPHAASGAAVAGAEVAAAEPSRRTRSMPAPAPAEGLSRQAPPAMTAAAVVLPDEPRRAPVTPGPEAPAAGRWMAHASPRARAPEPKAGPTPPPSTGAQASSAQPSSDSDLGSMIGGRE